MKAFRLLVRLDVLMGSATLPSSTDVDVRTPSSGRSRGSKAALRLATG